MVLIVELVIWQIVSLNRLILQGVAVVVAVGERVALRQPVLRRDAGYVLGRDRGNALRIPIGAGAGDRPEAPVVDDELVDFGFVGERKPRAPEDD